MTEQGIVRPVEGIVFRRLAAGQGGVLLHLETGAYHGLNETGAVLWELMGEERSVADVRQAFLDLVESAPDEARSEVDAFFGSLRDRGLVTITPP